MPSPFPGMDPYLEGYLWADVHQALAYQCRRQLVPLVAPRYAVRLAVTMLTDRVPGPELGIMYPDVEILRPHGAADPTSLAALCCRGYSTGTRVDSDRCSGTDTPGHR